MHLDMLISIERKAM